MLRVAVVSLLLAHSEPCETQALGGAAPWQRKLGGRAAAGADCCQALLGRDEGVDASSFLQMGLSLALRPGSRTAEDFSQPGEHRLHRLAELRDKERKLLLQLALAPRRAAAEAAEESTERNRAVSEADAIEHEVAMLEARISELSRLRDSLRTGKALLLEAPAAKPNVTNTGAAGSGQASDTPTALLSPSAPAASAPNNAKIAKASAAAGLRPSTPAAAHRTQSAKATTLHVARNASQSASKAASQATALHGYAASGNATPGDAQSASLNASLNALLNASLNASQNASQNASEAAGQASEAAGQAPASSAGGGGRGANTTTPAAAAASPTEAISSSTATATSVAASVTTTEASAPAASVTSAEAISSSTTTATSVVANATTTEASAAAANVTSTQAAGGAAWSNTSTSGSGGGASTTTSGWQADRRDTVGMTPALRSRGVVSAVIFIVVVLAVIASLIFLVLFRRADP